VLFDACAAGRRLHLAYRRAHRAGDSGNRDMAVDPWAVVLRHSRWYLLCWSHTVGARRVLRIDRIVTASQSLETFTPPTGLDALAVLEEHLSQGWAYEVDVRIEATVAAVARWLPPSLGALSPAADDRHTRLRASTSDPGWYVGRLAVLPYAFHVNGSAELRQAAADLGRRLIAAAAADSAAPALSE
jgi:predicted DNA-binding transcriptional regulator YafY